ncbi:MAG: hypothetical protein AAF415_15235 [Pseudomonadota bacterium]
MTVHTAALLALHSDLEQAVRNADSIDLIGQHNQRLTQIRDALVYAKGDLESLIGELDQYSPKKR